MLSTSVKEDFVVLYLNTRHRIVGMETVSVGTLGASLVHPREVFKAAILRSTHAIICGHNHPSGELEPSADDIEICTRVRRVGELLGIEVVDFLIVFGSEFRSFKEEGSLTA